MDLTKNKQRQKRRQRNFVAKKMLEDRAFRQRRIEPKRKREKIKVRDVDYETTQED